MLWLVCALSSWAVATSRFERQFTSYGLIGVEKTVSRRLDRLLREQPYFVDLSRALHKAYNQRVEAELDRCEPALRADLRRTLVERLRVLRELELDVLVMISFLDPAVADLEPLERRLVGLLRSTSDGTVRTVQRLARDLANRKETLTAPDLIVLIDRATGRGATSAH